LKRFDDTKTTIPDNFRPYPIPDEEQDVVEQTIDSPMVVTDQITPGEVNGPHHMGYWIYISVVPQMGY
jgi:hypothetical protein